MSFLEKLRRKKESAQEKPASRRAEDWDDLSGVKFAGAEEVAEALETRAETKNFNTEAMSEAEKMEVLGKAQIEGDAWVYGGQEYKLTTEILETQGLSPERKMTLDNAEIAFSKVYTIGRREAVVAYVKVDDKLKVRSYYKSNSQGVWRYLPDYVRNEQLRESWWGKGYNEESLTLPSEIQSALAEVEELGYQELTTAPSFILEGTAKRVESRAVYREMTTQGRLKGEFYEEVAMRPIVQLGGGAQSIRKENPESLSLPEGFAPNFEKLRESWKTKSSLYGEMECESFDSNNRNLKWMMSRDEMGRVWVSGVEAKGKVSSTGLRVNWVSAGDFATPLYEYKGQDGGYGDQSDIKGSYASMFKNYLSKLAPVRRYLDERLLAGERINIA